MEGIQILIILVGMVGAAFFSGIETGVISIHRMRLRHFVRLGSRRARLLQEYLNSPDRLFGATLVGTNICVVTLSVVSAGLAVHWIGPAWGEVVSTIVMTVLVLLFCEYLPKAWFHARPLERTQRFAGTLRMGELILRPISAMVIGLTRWFVPGASKSFAKPAPFVTREDLKVLAHEGEQSGILSPEERVMIHRVFELSGKRARDIMTPRKDIRHVIDEMSMDDFFKRVRETNISRMPVLDKGGETFVGIINVFYALPLESQDIQQKQVREFMRPPLFIPASMPVDDILPRLRRSHQPMALVRGDKGAVIGLVTTEDVLKEIVGKL